MLHRLPLLAALAAFLTAAAPAHAQVHKHLKEVGFNAGFQTTEGYTDYSASGSLGYFVTPVVQVGPLLAVQHVQGRVLNPGTRVAVGAQAALHLARPGATTVPFIGGSVLGGLVGYEGVVGEVRGGGKVFLTPSVALVPSVFAQFRDRGDAVFGFQAGFSVFL